MRITVEHKILLSFMAATVIVTMLGVTSLLQQQRGRSAQLRVEHDLSVLQAVRQVLELELDAETGQRGYLITGNPAYLGPYRRAVAGIKQGLDQLQAILPDNDHDGRLMARLRRLSGAKLAELAKTIQLRQERGFSAARQLVATDAGYSALNEIRGILRGLRQHYRRALDQERGRAEHRVALAFLLLAGFAAGVIVVLSWAYVLIIRDIHKRRVLTERLKHEASHDPLTGLPNQRFFSEWLQHTLAQAARDRSQSAVLFVDLDNFKAVNDQQGHRAGDQVLRAVAARLKQTARAGDILARVGGDEFAVLIPNVSEPPEPAGLAQRIISAFSAPFAEIDGLPLGTSIGIALFPDDARGAEALVSAADGAMYRAKSAGGHRYCFVQEERNAVLSREARLRADLFHCTERGELAVLYQPIVDAQGRISSLEALVRWEHPEFGTVSPDEFIPHAEQSGSILLIDRFVRQTVVEQGARWLAQGYPVSIAVNMSAVGCSDGGLLGTVLEDLEAVQLPNRYFTIEIAESVLLDSAAMEGLRGLYDRGFNLILDDFGTGFSSLSYLLHFPVSGLKIDRSFIAGLPAHADSRRLVSIILQMVRTLHLSVVAEGVETEEQARWLVQQGCDRLQGYYYGRPMAASEIEPRLQQERARAPADEGAWRGRTR